MANKTKQKLQTPLELLLPFFLYTEKPKIQTNAKLKGKLGPSYQI